MARHKHDVYASAKTPRHLVLFDLQWKIVECLHLEPAADLSSAMATAIECLTEKGWRPEGSAKFGFVFLNREGVRQLLILTERDPHDQRLQAFSPFR
jgi:hypothetical protein